MKLRLLEKKMAWGFMLLLSTALVCPILGAEERPLVPYGDVLTSRDAGWRLPVSIPGGTPGTLPAAVGGARISDDGATNPVLLNVRRMESAKMVIDYAIPSPALALGTTAAPKGATDQSEGRAETIVLSTLPLIGMPGSPQMPVIPVSLILPAGWAFDHAEVITGSLQPLPGNHYIEPAARPVPLGTTPGKNRGEADATIYGAESAYPSQTFTVEHIQGRRGVKTLTVNLHPMVYHPRSGKVSYYDAIRLVVMLNRSPGRLSGGEIRFREAPFDAFKGRVENPEFLQGYQGSHVAPLGTSRTIRGAGSLCDPSESYDYVVVTNQAIRDAETDLTVQDLLAEKQQSGLSTTVVLIEDVLATYTGQDTAEQLRNFIKDAYNNWETDYVLLGGDTNIIPMRKLYSGNQNGDTLPSDLYYQCLDGSYNANGNGFWGEAVDGETGGMVDLESEVYIGRASAENAEEFSNFVYKTLAYAHDAANLPYLKRALMCGEKLGFGGASEYAKASMEEIRLGADTHQYTTAGFAADPSISVDSLYAQDTGSWGFAEIHEKMVGGVSLINHLGHSNTSFGLGFSNWEAMNLQNERPFFAYSQGCIAGNFEGDCLAERITTSHRHGAFAVVMNSRYGWGAYNSTHGYSQQINRPFWDGYFGERQLTRLGPLNANSHEASNYNVQNLYVRWVIYESNLFGDPHLALRAQDVVGPEPGANAGADQMVHSGVQVVLDGSASKDGEQFTWAQIDGPDVVLNGASSARASFTALNTTGTNVTLKFRLTVTDHSGVHSSDECSVVVEPVENKGPVARAGSDKHIACGKWVALDGRESSTPNGSITQYKWTQIAGPDVKMIYTDSAYAYALAPETDATLEFRLTVIDSSGRSDSATCTVVCGDGGNQAPVANAGPDIKGALNSWAFLDGRDSSDPDGTIRHFKWTQTGGPTVRLDYADREYAYCQVPGIPGVLTFTLTVTDNMGAEHSDTCTVTGDPSLKGRDRD